MGGGRRLVQVEEFGDILAWGHRIEGTRLYVVEMLTFGFSYSSYYLLLKNPSIVSRLKEKSVRAELCRYPSRFGRKLEFGADLRRNSRIAPQGPGH
jgi:hypothetical protein